MDNPPIEESNAGALYRHRFQAVCNLFQAEGVPENAYRDSCIQLLADERCPLLYRVILQYMIAHTADDPVPELEEALYYLGVLDEMVLSGAVKASPWFASARAFLNEMLEACRTDGEDSNGEDLDVEANEEAGELKTFGEDDDEPGTPAQISMLL